MEHANKRGRSGRRHRRGKERKGGREVVRSRLEGEFEFGLLLSCRWGSFWDEDTEGFQLLVRIDELGVERKKREERGGSES